MPKVQYVGPHGSVEIPALGIVVEFGDIFDVPEDGAGSDLAQQTDFESVDTKAAKAETPEEG